MAHQTAKTVAEPGQWFESWSNVIDLAEWLWERGDINEASIFYMLRKPWKYERQWNQFQAER